MPSALRRMHKADPGSLARHQPACSRLSDGLLRLPAVGLSRQGTITAMTDEVIIREVATTDFKQWLPLWEGYNAFYKRVGPAAIPAEVTRTTWARFFDSYEPVNALVAERGGRLLGLAHYIFHRNTTM